jgi:hypothetical protein
MDHADNLSYLEGGDWASSDKKLQRPHLNQQAEHGGVPVSLAMWEVEVGGS